MKAEFENRTAIPTASLLPLIEWARGFTGGDAETCGLLLAHKKRGDRIEGRAASAAFVLGRKAKGFKQGLPFVRILISPRWETNVYPMVETYVKGISIEYRDWKEHLLVYLAHEFKHIRQYQDRREWSRGAQNDHAPWRSSREREVDAERFAIRALESFRDSATSKMEISNKREAETKRCPRCGVEGDVVSMFGLRKVKGKMIPQSYCYPCRKFHSRR